MKNDPNSQQAAKYSTNTIRAPRAPEFDLVLESVGLAYWDQDFETGRIYRSPAWSEMLGYDPAEVAKDLSGWSDLVHPDDLPGVLEAARAHKAGETDSFSVEHRMKAKSGEWRWIYNWGRIVKRAPDGRALRAFGTHMDVTERKRSEEALRESEARYRTVVEQSPDNIFLLDAETAGILDTNPALQELLEYSETEMREMTLYDFSASSRDVIAAQIRTIIEKGHQVMAERYYRRKDGTLVPVEVSVSRIQLRGKWALSVMSRDISARKATEAESEKAREELETRVRERMAELEEVNRQLEIEREALNHKNVALREILKQFESGRKSLSSQIQANVDRIAKPLLAQLEGGPDPRVSLSARLLEQALEEVTSPFVDRLGSRFDRLSPREIQVCGMIRNGLTTKDISRVLGTSPETVRKQRVAIRLKLKLTNSGTNLASFLQSIELGDAPPTKN